MEAVVENAAGIAPPATNITSAPNATFYPEDYCLVQHLIYSDAATAIFGLLYAAIFVCGIAGNLLVCIAVLKAKHLHTVTNFFIANLAASDILMCTFSVPFTPLQSFSGKWVFGEVLCKLFPFSQGVSVYISTLTLTIIAVDRFVVIVYPFRARMQIKTCLALVLIIDVAACVFTAPYAVHMEVSEAGGGNGTEPVYRCSESWFGLVRTIYGAFTNIAQFVLPFISIIFCYTAVMRKLGDRRNQGRKNAGNQASDNRPDSPFFFHSDLACFL